MKLGVLCGEIGLALSLDLGFPRVPLLRTGDAVGLDTASKLSVLLTGEGEGLPKAMVLKGLDVSVLDAPCAGRGFTISGVATWAAVGHGALLM